MANSPNKLSRFWQELKRRKVLPFVIGYIAASIAIISFLLDSSDIFSVPEDTIRLLYLLAVIGIPIVIILPWFINRKKTIGENEEVSTVEASYKEKNSEDSTAAKHNLPAQLTTFIGREKEKRTVKDLISEYRLVTLTGPGGCGKTRTR
jgi:hypothetical protein